MKKQVIVSILTNPLASKKKLEYLIKNVNNGLAHYHDDYEITLEIITWWATKIEDDLLYDNLQNLDENYINEITKFRNFIDTSVQPKLQDKINDNRKVFDDINCTSYKNINNIKCNHSFEDKYNFKGYGAVHQFELLTEHIRQNSNCSFYIFISSNYCIHEKSLFSFYIKRLEKHKIPFITHIPIVETEPHKNMEIKSDFVRLRHGNLNSFACNPTQLIDFLDNKIKKVFDHEEYERRGEKVTLGSSFGNWEGRCIKNYKHAISDDYLIHKEDLVDTSIFPFDDGTWEPAVQFPLFLLQYCIRYPDTYDTPLVPCKIMNYSGEVSMEINLPYYSFEKSFMFSKFNKTQIETTRYKFFYEPYFNQEVIFNILHNIDKNLKPEIDVSVAKRVEKALDKLIDYFDNSTYSDNRKEVYLFPIFLRETELYKTLNNETLYDKFNLSTKLFSKVVIDYFK